MTLPPPPPPVPVDADLRHFPDMPLQVGRLRDSDIASTGDPEIFRCGVMLWCAAWHQVPAGSLPNEDATLARLAGLGRDLRTWRRLKPGALRGFQEFADGRLYHRVVCEKVIEGLNSTLLHRWHKACARVRKENHQRAKQMPKLPKLSNPDRPGPLSLNWPTDNPVRAPEREPSPPVRVPEREYDSEGKGRESFPRGSHTANPLGTVLDERDHPPIAARATALEGPHAHDAERRAAELLVTATKSLRVVS
jgi:hypothetical protein